MTEENVTFGQLQDQTHLIHQLLRSVQILWGKWLKSHPWKSIWLSWAIPVDAVTCRSRAERNLFAQLRRNCGWDWLAKVDAVPRFWTLQRTRRLLSFLSLLVVPNWKTWEWTRWNQSTSVFAGDVVRWRCGLQLIFHFLYLPWHPTVTQILLHWTVMRVTHHQTGGRDKTTEVHIQGLKNLSNYRQYHEHFSDENLCEQDPFSLKATFLYPPSGSIFSQWMDVASSCSFATAWTKDLQGRRQSEQILLQKTNASRPTSIWQPMFHA